MRAMEALETVVEAPTRAELTVTSLDSRNLHVQGYKHRFIRFAVENIDEAEPVVPITRGQLAVGKLLSLRPQPIGDNFSVCWDGDVLNPKLRFDGWPPKRAVIEVEVWGI